MATFAIARLYVQGSHRQGKERRQGWEGRTDGRGRVEGVSCHFCSAEFWVWKRQRDQLCVEFKPFLVGTAKEPGAGCLRSHAGPNSHVLIWSLQTLLRSVFILLAASPQRKTIRGNLLFQPAPKSGCLRFRNKAERISQPMSGFFKHFCRA